MPGDNRYCTFTLENCFFGVEVLKVQEVLRHHEMTRVPLAPSLIEGLINLRGQIVTAVDLRRRLGFPERCGDRLPMNVVLGTEGGVVSLLVDEIGDVLEVSEDEFERGPENLPEGVRKLIRGVYKLKDRLLLILDIDAVVAAESSAAVKEAA